MWIITTFSGDGNGFDFQIFSQITLLDILNSTKHHIGKFGENDATIKNVIVDQKCQFVFAQNIVCTISV